MTERRYGDPAALRQALTDRLRLLVRQRPGAQLADLQRQFAYDRLLSRVFVDEPDAWVVKGATALLARMQGSARHTVDVDLYRRYAGLDEAERALRAATSVDLGDFFRFELSPGRGIAQGRPTLRIPAIAYLGATEFARFHVDLVTDLVMTGEPDEVAALIPFEIPGIDPVRYRAYPVADHVADKVCAFLEVRPRALGTAQPSTRYRDLADLTLIAHSQPIDADELRSALASEVRRRGLLLPSGLPSPGAAGWRAGYARMARDVPGLLERDLDSALATVRRLLDSVFDGTAAGTWDPRTLTWSG